MLEIFSGEILSGIKQWKRSLHLLGQWKACTKTQLKLMIGDDLSYDDS